jgi:hypothetical protein
MPLDFTARRAQKYVHSPSFLNDDLKMSMLRNVFLYLSVIYLSIYLPTYLPIYQDLSIYPS